jgi:aerobic carbon-monoxide dehydrogenase large subunit
LVGRPIRRREDERILRGGTRYLDDIEPPGAAHVAFVRSPFAHARIGGVEVPDALEGTFAAITAADLEGRVGDLPVQGIQGGWVADEGHPVLAGEEVRYSGQPVARSPRTPPSWSRSTTSRWRPCSTPASRK